MARTEETESHLPGVRCSYHEMAAIAFFSGKARLHTLEIMGGQSLTEPHRL